MARVVVPRIVVPRLVVPRVVVPSGVIRDPAMDWCSPNHGQAGLVSWAKARSCRRRDMIVIKSKRIARQRNLFENMLQ